MQRKDAVDLRREQDISGQIPCLKRKIFRADEMLDSENLAEGVAICVKKRCKKVLETKDFVFSSRRIERCESEDFRVGFGV